jgi:hypothetical protein
MDHARERDFGLKIRFMVLESSFAMPEGDVPLVI